MIVFLLLVIVILTGYVLNRRALKYWSSRGIPQLSPSILVGDFGNVYRRLGVPETWSDLYEQSKHFPLVGLYLSVHPVLMINDPELIRNVLGRDFEHFHDRGIDVNEKEDPLSGHMFALSGEKWRQLRSKLTQAFSSGRLKGMLPIVIQKATVLQEYVERSSKCGKTLEMKDLSNRFLLDVISSVAFGVENDLINNPKDIFSVMVSRVLHPSLKNIMRLGCTFFFPKIKRTLGFKFIDQDVEDFFVNMVDQTLEYREKNQVFRKDMMQLLIQLRNSGLISMDDDSWDVKVSDTNKNMTIYEVTAQMLLFIFAGFETSASTISYCLFELSRNPDLQERAQSEIDSVFSKSNGEPNYESLAQLKFLEGCVFETLRKYPPLSFLNRECIKDYQVPGTDITVEKGTQVVISLLGLQRDPNFFPEPDRFNPNRFGEQGLKTDKPYLPFGFGPRGCTGIRMGLMITKMSLAMLLSKFEFRLASDDFMNKELKFDKSTMTLSPVGGINLVACLRETSR
ncbi:probable cytochrome P450 6d5 [Uranotaenia lowii]|uniref:probable cytochrome P450 6d5 n=1 Tax=Uranotaenia lowii TaxID=190385 RepID=UPI002478597F|nr:probable cytochrome P450 6d5 [Uranotaenia lowii]